MKVAVKDANVLIDLAEADLLGLWFKLDFETHATDLVLREIKRVEQWKKVSPFVDAGLIRERRFDEAGMKTVVAAAAQLKVSIADASAFLVARELKAVLLSGDSDLRKAALAARIEVHGILWIFDRLISASVLLPTDAATRLQTLVLGNSYLPKLECEKRILQWSKSVY